MIDFNKITEENELAAKAKFREYGVGIKMGSYASGDDAKWEELINPGLYSMSAIKTKMLEISRRINTICNDELLGDLSVAFSVVDERDRRISFTWMEMYTFLRAAYRYRMETADYKAKKAKVAKLRKFIEENKSVDDKLTDASKELAALEGELED